MHAHAFFKACLVFIFLNTIVKKHTLNPEFAFGINFMLKKFLFKDPKICNIILGFNSAPLWNFSKNSSDLVAGPLTYHESYSNSMEFVNFNIDNMFYECRDWKCSRPRSKGLSAVFSAGFGSVTKARFEKIYWEWSLTLKHLKTANKSCWS